MNFVTNLITQQELLNELIARYGEGDWEDMLDEADYALVAEMADFKNYPQYYAFENTNNAYDVVEFRDGKIVNIYHMEEGQDYQRVCESVFWKTAHEWTDDVETTARDIYWLKS